MIGEGKPIEDAAWKVTGRKRYVGDMKVPQMAYGKILFSPVPHGNIVRIDTSKAEALPGVLAVADYRNTPATLYNSAKRFIGQQVICNETIFSKRCRFVGDRVAAVAAESEEIAAEAVKLIEVEYDQLPFVTDIASAIREDAYPVHEGGNVITEMEVHCGNTREAFLKCDHVIEGTYTTSPIHHAAIEPHAVLAEWGPDGKLSVYSPNQNCFAFRVILSDIFGLPLNRIRVCAPAIGGAFGGKLEMTIEPVAAVLSKLAARPVKIVLSRRETMMATRVRHGSLSHIKTGFDNDGKIRAMEFKIYTNTGAYASSALNVAGALTHKVFLAYNIPNMKIKAVPVYTNTETAGAMRGYGSPQIYFGMQRQVNEVARVLGKDPAEIQRINMVRPESINPVSGEKIGNPRPLDCLEKALRLSDYEKAIARQKQSKMEKGDIRIGVGIALGVHGNNCFGVHRDNTSPMLKMNEDGTCLLYTGSHDMGTDTVGMQKQIVAEVLGITADRITAVAADTDSCLWHIGDYSSRGVFVVGEAARRVAEKMKILLLEEAGKYFGVDPGEICIRDNQVSVADDPEKNADIKEIMIYCQSVSNRELCVHQTYEAVRGAASYGVHIAETEVNIKTGTVQIRKYTAVHDVGKILNPMMIEGQLQGAVQMGIGYALSEGMYWDDKGQPKPLTLKKCGVLRANGMPDQLITDFVETEEGEPGGPFGAKALGECPVVPAAPAVLNSICNALDIELNNLPAEPDRILRTLKGEKKDD